MDLREQILRRRKDWRVIIGGLIALLAVCALVYFMLQRGRGLPTQMATNKVLLFVLWYINVLLILTILFVLVRSIFRLLIERQNRILGSKFKTKLVATAIGLSLIPVLILFPFATRLLLDSFDQWFTLPVDEVVEQARDTAEYLAAEIERNNLRAGRRVLDRMIGYDLEDLEQLPALQGDLQQLREELQIDFLAVYDGTAPIHGTADVSAGFRRMPDVRGLQRLLEEAIADGSGSRIVDEHLDIEGRLFLSAVARPRPPAPPAEGESSTARAADPRHTLVLAGTVLPPDLAETSENLIAAYQSYLQLEVQKEDLRAAYLLNLLMVTLLVILAFSSIGLRLARRVTVPIQALAEATARVRTGDLDHRVEVAVDDELGALVGGFNEMTADLRRNRELVERTTRQLRSSNKRLAAVLANVAAGVIAIDADGDILTCNDAALAILAQREHGVVGHSARDAWSDPERGKLVALLAEDFTAGGQIQRQLEMTIGGVWKTLEVKVTTLPDAEGRPGGRVLVLEDLTELLQAQTMAAWNEVARRIAHEIKNPLTPIQLTAERLLRKHRAGDRRLGEVLEQGVPVIVREVESLKSMVDEFSRFARMPQPQPRDIDLEGLFDELVNLHRGIKPGVRVEREIGADAGVVRFDPDQLKGALINLLDNALEATDAPGTVRLEAERVDGRILVRVRDTGRGLRGVDKEKVFLPYFSTKGRGTGLGLSIVHRIVSDHRATIQVADNTPHGAVFTIEVAAT
ncbi:MAG: ATP-binding protein [Acidobacteriota bacterium]